MHYLHVEDSEDATCLLLIVDCQCHSKKRSHRDVAAADISRIHFVQFGGAPSCKRLVSSPSHLSCRDNFQLLCFDQRMLKNSFITKCCPRHYLTWMELFRLSNSDCQSSTNSYCAFFPPSKWKLASLENSIKLTKLESSSIFFQYSFWRVQISCVIILLQCLDDVGVGSSSCSSVRWVTNSKLVPDTLQRLTALEFLQ